MSMSELAGGLASASRSADGFHYVPGYMDQLPTVSVIGKIAVPAMAVGILGVGSRVGMVVVAMTCEGLIKITDYAEKKELSETLTQAKDRLYAKATNVDTMKAEFNTAIWLTARAVVVLCLSKWLTPEPKPFWKF